MRYFTRFNVVPAIRDLRFFLAQRQRHELWFGVLAVVLTGTILVGFLLDSRVEPPPRTRDIQFVESWPLSRTDREIIDQQKRDLVKLEARDAELRRERRERRRQFQQLDNQLEALGF